MPLLHCKHHPNILIDIGLLKRIERNTLHPDKSFRITLLRHAQSIANQEGILQGQSDFALSDSGETQARELALTWQQSDVSFDRIICSPLKRANQTAHIIASTLAVPLVVDTIWKERAFGHGEGISIDDLPRHVKRLHDRVPHEPLFEDAESDWDLFYRASQALHSILDLTPGHYLVVAHGGLMRAALDSIMGRLPGMARRSSFRLYNLAWITLCYFENQGSWTFLAPCGACPLPIDERS